MLIHEAKSTFQVGLHQWAGVQYHRSVLLDSKHRLQMLG